jgi:hypothetical protein
MVENLHESYTNIHAASTVLPLAAAAFSAALEVGVKCPLSPLGSRMNSAMAQARVGTAGTMYLTYHRTCKRKKQ